jgi:acyl carrier protein
MSENNELTWNEIYEGVSAILVEALGVDASLVRPEATLRDDLAAESIDFLDIFFRIERRFGVTFSRKDFTIGIASDDWGSKVSEAQLRQPLTAEELQRMRELFKEVDPSKIAPGLTYADIGGLFTVTTLVNFVVRKIQTKKAHGASVR